METGLCRCSEDAGSDEVILEWGAFPSNMTRFLQDGKRQRDAEITPEVGKAQTGVRP